MTDRGGADGSDEALRASEARQAFLLKLSDALRPLAEPAEITGTATRLLGEQMAASRTYYAEWPPGETYGEVARDYAAPGLPSLAGRYPIDVFRSAFDRVRQGLTWIVEDAASAIEIDAAERRHYLDAGVTAWINVPLIKRGKALAVLCVVQAEPRRWTRDEIRLAEETAERCWAAVERGRAETALVRSEEKYRTLFETMGQGYCSLELLRDAQGHAVDFRYVELNPAFERLIGVKVADAEGRMASAVIPQLEAWWTEAFDRIAKRGEPERIEHEVAPLGRWFEVFAYPRGGDRLTLLYADVTERKRAEAALRESEERFRQFGEASSDVLWVRDAATLKMEYLSAAFETLYGAERLAFLHDGAPEHWAELIHPDDRERVLANLERVRSGERVEHEFRVVRPSDMEQRWLRDTLFPLFDEDGRVARIAGIAHDITAARQAAERQRLLLAELQHRVRNTLGVIRSVARRTAETSETVEDYAMHLEGRIDAFARVQGAVTREPTGGVDLEFLVAEGLLAYGAHEGAQVAGIKGPKILLRTKAAENMALAVHELATNAVKYGALATPEGRIHVSWTVERDGGNPTMVFEWTEWGAELDGSEPRRRGFGTELLERTLAHELKARTTLRFGEPGLRCVVEIPLTERIVVSGQG